MEETVSVGHVFCFAVEMFVQKLAVLGGWWGGTASPVHGGGGFDGRSRLSGGLILGGKEEHVGEGSFY